MGLFSKTICGVCGGTIRGQYVQVKDRGGRGSLLYNLCPDCNQKFRMVTRDKVPYPTNPVETGHIIRKGANPAGVIEKRMRCNVCGEIFCYSDKDLARNRQIWDAAIRARNSAVREAVIGTTIASNQQTARAESLEAQVVDYSKCPKCHSTDLKEISADEFKAIQEGQPKGRSANVSEADELKAIQEEQSKGRSANVSIADELKKFKELLDMGAISQEEFDAMKKRLLGL